MKSWPPGLVWLLAAVQLLCGGYFLWEILSSRFLLPPPPIGWQAREVIEIAATLGLIVGALLGARLAIRAGQAAWRAEAAHRLTAGEFSTVVDDYFTRIDLTPAERDVAWLILKGQSIGDIAALRGTAEGTVRAQSTAIYRKAGVTGKVQLLTSLVEDLLL